MWLTDLKFKICAEVVVHRKFAVFLNSLNGKNSSSIVRDIFCSRFQDNTTSNFYIVISEIRIVSYTRDQHLLFVYDRAPASKSCAFCIGIKFFFSPFDRFLVPSCCKGYFLEKVSCMQHLMRFRGRVSSQIQSGGFTTFANLLCKTVKCHEGSFLKNKISFAEEVIGNIIKSWKPHIDFVSKKISKSVGIIAKARFYLSSQTLMTLYYSNVYPFLTYCNVAWSSTYRSSVNCIYLLPKHLVRLITKPHYLAKTTPSERLRSDGSVATSFGLYVICSQLFSSCIRWSYSYFQLFYILSLSYSHGNSRQHFPSQWELSY